jgi:hypothetical protein
MRYLLLISLVASIVGFQSCKDDKEGTLALHFKALYDDETLQTFQTFPFDNGQQLQFTHLSMMISDLELTKGASGEGLDEIELVDLSFDNLTAAEDGYTLTISGIPASAYDGIRFGVGVPPDVNQKTPSDYTSESPLSKTGYYWSAWNSYIFMKTEGRLDTLGNGTLDLGFAIHTGSDPLFRTLIGTLPISIEDGKTTELEILIDYKKLLQGVDIKSNPQNHSPQDTVQILKLVNNLNTAITLRP